MLIDARYKRMELRMKRLISLLALIILFGFGLPQTSFAADEEEGVSSLEKGDPIRHLMLLRSGRFEIAPGAQFGINETFSQTIGFGAQLSYYFTNYLGLGASFYYNPLHIKGKFAVYKLIFNYDLHLYAGFGAIMMESVCGAGGSVCEDAKNNSLEGPKFAGVLGIGFRVFFNNFVALNLDVKNYLTSYADFSRGPTDDRSRFKDFVTGTIGVSFFFPVTVYMSR